MLSCKGDTLAFRWTLLEIEYFYRYDTYGIFSAPRALFMFRSFGHEQSSVLDGGLPRWESEGLPTESGPVVETPRTEYPAPTLASENIRSEYSRAVL